MITKHRTANIVSFFLNVAVVMMEMVAILLSWCDHGSEMLQFYTEDSNIFAMIACAIMAICQIRNLRCGKKDVPVWAKTIKYMAVCCLSVTFVVVLCVLAPMYGGLRGYKMMFFSGSMLYNHFLNPMAAFVSFVFFERTPKLERRAIIYTLIPTLAYAVTTITLNIMKVMEGPYPFLRVYKQSAWISAMWCVLILGGAYLFALLIWRLNKNKHTENYT